MFFNPRTILSFSLALLLFHQVAAAEEFHPRLFFNASEIPALAQKLDDSIIAGTLGTAITATLKGERSQASIDVLNAAIAADNQHYEALLVYDVQYHYLTPGERSSARTFLLNAAQEIRDDFINVVGWWYDPRMMNNWTTKFRGSPLPVLLYSGIIFEDDPRAASYRSEALKALRNVMTGSPNNGEYNRTTKSWDTYPTVVDGWDEAFVSQGTYGGWTLQSNNELMFVASRHLNEVDFETFFGRMFERETKHWVYSLSHHEGIDFAGPADSYAGFAGYGSTPNSHLSYSSTMPLMYRAYLYNEPVFAWLSLANYSWTRGDPENFLDNWNLPLDSYFSFLHFKAWGEVEPKSPVEAGWSLSEFWENAGIGIIRKSWTKNARVIADQGMPDDPRGLVWLHGGPMGSKYRGTVGGVYYSADDEDILGAAPFICTCGLPGSDFLNITPYGHNGLFIDGIGKPHLGSLIPLRERSAQTSRLGPDTFKMDMSKNNRSDYRGYFEGTAITSDLSWTRKVHYDRKQDILWIKDEASLSDSSSHQFRFNWVSDNPTLGASKINLPNGYQMVYDSNLPVVANVLTHDQATIESGEDEHTFQSVQIGGNGTKIRMLWAIGKDEAAASAYIAKNRGVFISGVSAQHQGNSIDIGFSTDETSQVRIEYGTSSSLGQSITETASGSGNRTITIPVNLNQEYYFRIIAPDASGEETVDDNDRSLYFTGNRVSNPSNLRIIDN